MNAPKDVTRAHLPSFINSVIPEISFIELLVNEEARDASWVANAKLTSD